MFILEDAIRAADGLEPLPPTVSRLAVLVATPEAELPAIVETIAFDPTLAGTVLRYANSAASAALSPVVTVRDAIIRLGRAAVLSLALGTHVRPGLSEALPEYGLEEGDLWRSSVLAAIAAELLAARASVRTPPELGAAALLADTGKLVLHRALDAETLAWLGRAQASGLTRTEAESEVLGVHHGELGALIAVHWGLPTTIVAGIEYHHAPGESMELVSYATHLSCAVAGVLMDDPDATRAGWDGDSLAALGLGAADLDGVAAAAAARLHEVEARYDACT